MTEQAAIDLISVPKGGGALAGIGESFQPDLHTGTGSYRVPLDLPPGRNGFQPHLALGYSTGGANGPFGLGWSLDVPGIQRKTAKGIPRYDDRDVFVLSGTEDLVPVPGGPTSGGAGQTRYRPRTEGTFARIVHHVEGGSDYWEVWSKEGLRTRYGSLRPVGAAPGWTDPATVADPAGTGRIFAWRLSQTVDPLGNRIEYAYVPGAAGEAQIYLSELRYADYGDPASPRFLVSVRLTYEARPDPFSDRRAGFEVRTSRRCTAVETWTAANQPVLARRMKIEYLDTVGGQASRAANGVSLLTRIVAEGHDGPAVQAAAPVEFGYTTWQPETRRYRPLSAPGGQVPDTSLGHRDTELVDLFGDGLPAVIQMNGRSRFWRNLGGGRLDAPRSMPTVPAGVSLGRPGVQLADFDGDGRADLLVTTTTGAGYYPLARDGGFDPRGFVRLPKAPTFSLTDPLVRLVDLDGDGIVDVLRTGDAFELAYNDGHNGFTALQVRRRGAQVPDVSFADPRVKLADMTGDGLTDIVVVHDRRVEYWPYLGYGRWGAKVSMTNSPAFGDANVYGSGGFDPRRLLVGDVDGDGCADVVYVGNGQVTVWVNRTGNGFAPPVVIRGTPVISDGAAVRLADMLGTGTAGVLWTYDQGTQRDSTYKFLDLTGGVKPYLLTTVDSHMGSTTTINYAPSSRYAIKDLAAGTPWRTTLPFPVQVVSSITVADHFSQSTLVSEFSYHHGYWDGAEREFRGFGRTDERDAVTFIGTGDGAHPHSPPTETRTWFHLGPVGPEFGAWHQLDLSDEYWAGDPRLLPADDLSAIPAGLGRRGIRDVVRSLRGSILRTELYGLDGRARQSRPYTVTEGQVAVGPILDGRSPDDPAWLAHPIVFPHALATRTTQWERGDEPLTTVTFTTDYDGYGRPHRQVHVAVPRGRDPRVTGPSGDPYLATVNRTEYATRDDAQRYFADRVVLHERTEVVNDGSQTLWAIRDGALGGGLALRVRGHELCYYDGPAFQGLPWGQLGDWGLKVRTEQLALTTETLLAGYQGGDPTVPLPPYLRPAAPGPVPVAASVAARAPVTAAIGGAPAWPAEYPQAFRDRMSDGAGYTHHAEQAPFHAGWYVPTGRVAYDVQPPSPGTVPPGGPAVGPRAVGTPSLRAGVVGAAAPPATAAADRAAAPPTTPAANRVATRPCTAGVGRAAAAPAAAGVSTTVVDPVGFIGQYVISGPNMPGGVPVVASGRAELALPAGDYWFDHARIVVPGTGQSMFSFTVAAEGTVSNISVPEAATATGNTLRLNNAQVSIDPGSYPGQYALSMDYTTTQHQGAVTATVIPGLLFSVDVGAAVGGPQGDSYFYVRADINGAVVAVSNPVAAHFTGTTVGFNSTTVTFDPGDFSGTYRVSRYPNAYLSGRRDVVVVAGLMSGLDNGSAIGGSELFFLVDADGQVTCTTGSATGGDHQLRLNTSRIRINPGSYSSPYSVGGYGATSGVATLAFIRFLVVAVDTAPQGHDVFTPSESGTDKPTLTVGTETFELTNLSAPRGLVTVHRDAIGNDTMVGYDDFGLFPALVTDAAQMVRTAVYDYRVMRPVLVTDPNGNRTRVSYTPLGLPAWIAALGKAGRPEGDTAEQPGTTFDYGLTAWDDSHPAAREPSWVATTRRIAYRWQLVAAENLRRAQSGQPRQTDAEIAAMFPQDEAQRFPERFLNHREYSDGFGRLLQTRTQADDTVVDDLGLSADMTAPPTAMTTHQADPSTPPPVIVSGWQVYDNKGRVVEKYEPFFDTGWAYQLPTPDRLAQLARVATEYDPRGLAVRSVDPDGSERRLVPGIPTDLTNPDQYWPTPWESYAYDNNDNAGRTHAQESQSWSSHWNTPSSSLVDGLGRVIVHTERTAAAALVIRSVYDIDGNVLQVVDPLGRVASRSAYDLVKRAWRHELLDAGVTRIVFDATGAPVERRDAKGALRLFAYDSLRRSIRSWARDIPTGPVTLREVSIFGDDQIGSGLSPTQAAATNLLGRPARGYDEAGLVETTHYDLAGNLLEKSQRVLSTAVVLSRLPAPGGDWTNTSLAVDWEPPAGQTFSQHAEGLLDPAHYALSNTYDALSRRISLSCPTDVEGKRRLLQPTYGRSGALTGLDVDGTPFVRRILYNSRGQRSLAILGSSTMIRYAYHPHSFHLARIRSEPAPATISVGIQRASQIKGPPLPPTPPPPPPPAIQDYGYAYDLVGNPLSLFDRTPGGGVAPLPDKLDRTFSYDPLYRLAAATGRECDVAPTTPWSDAPRSIDLTRARGYTEQYTYDDVGNLLRLAHQASTGPTTRDFAPFTGGNRLSTMTVGANTVFGYAYDSAGNLLTETSSRRFDWDHANRLATFRVQTPGSEPSLYAQYRYHADGQRVLKVVRNQGGQPRVTIYIDGVFERLLLTDSSGTTQHDTVHVSDGASRIAIVRVGTPAPDDAAPPVTYHLPDHLGSSNVVVDAAGTFVNREEYTPYGETSFGSYAHKRYRFTGKERDEESGLSYHGARYYAPWLCRWISCDPAGIVDGPNLYAYVVDNPLRLRDTTGKWSYDPAALGDRLGAAISSGEQYAMAENTGLASSLWNTAVVTTGTVLKGMTSILQVGTGSAQGIQQISNAQDGWDIAIGISRVLVDGGDVAGAALGIAGTAAKGMGLAKDIKLARQIETAVEARSSATGTTAGRISEKIAELHTDRLANRAGLTKYDANVLSQSGGRTVHGVDRALSGKAPFSPQVNVVVEAKGRRLIPSDPTSLLQTYSGGLTQGSGAYNANRLARAAASGSRGAAEFLQRVGRGQPGSYLVAADAAGASGVFELQGMSGVPAATRVAGLPRVPTENIMIGVGALSATAVAARHP